MRARLRLATPPIFIIHQICALIHANSYILCTGMSSFIMICTYNQCLRSCASIWIKFYFIFLLRILCRSFLMSMKFFVSLIIKKILINYIYNQRLRARACARLKFYYIFLLRILWRSFLISMKFFVSLIFKKLFFLGGPRPP